VPLRHSDVVVDIGAYVGTFSIYCARFPVKKVIAYEPTPASFSVMELTQLRNLENRQMAVVGNEAVSVDLYISKGIGVTNSIVLSRNKAEAVMVNAINYAEAVRGASVVKIDVEGAEYGYPVVQPGVRALIVDFHKLPKDQGNWREMAEQMVRDIEAAGFEPIISPKFDASGWEQAGSWIRDIETTGQCDDLMNGLYCCGCGCELDNDQKVRSLCVTCYEELWSDKHRSGYLCAVIAK